MEVVVDVKVWILKLIGIIEAYNIIPSLSSAEVTKIIQSKFLYSKEFPSSNIESKLEIYFLCQFEA
jgi:hypothetical protein